MICQAPCQLLIGPKVVYRAAHPVVPISFILPSSHIDHLSLNDFLGPAADGVHGLHPAYRIGCFQFLHDALGLGHLLDNQAAPFSGLFVQVSQDGIQLPGQKQRLIKDRPGSFQVFSM